MKTAQISFEVSEGLLHALNQNQEEFTRQTRLIVALQLFEKQKISFGQAVELAGLTRERFLNELDAHDIDLINYDPSELAEELERFE